MRGACFDDGAHCQHILSQPVLYVVAGLHADDWRCVRTDSPKRSDVARSEFCFRCHRRQLYRTGKRERLATCFRQYCHARIDKQDGRPAASCNARAYPRLEDRPQCKPYGNGFEERAIYVCRQSYHAKRYADDDNNLNRYGFRESRQCQQRLSQCNFREVCQVAR